MKDFLELPIWWPKLLQNTSNFSIVTSWVHLSEGLRRIKSFVHKFWNRIKSQSAKRQRTCHLAIKVWVLLYRIEVGRSYPTFCLWQLNVNKHTNGSAKSKSGAFEILFCRTIPTVLFLFIKKYFQVDAVELDSECFHLLKGQYLRATAHLPVSDSYMINVGSDAIGW